MATAKLRVGLIGAGTIAARHLEVLSAMEDVVIAGITSRTHERAASLAAHFGTIPVFKDAGTLVRGAAPDALLVMVSAADIFEVTRVAVTYGLPLFIEKPAGLTPEEAAELARLAAARNIRNMVGYNRRYYSIFHQGLELIRRHGPVMGVQIEGHERIAAVRSTGKHPAAVLNGWLYANATHTIDLLRFFGGEITTLHCLTHRHREPLGDQFAAIMNFETGALGEYSAHWLSPGGWRVVLYGDGITVEFKPLESGRWTDSKGASHEISPSPDDSRFKPGFFSQMRAFCGLVRGAAPAWPLQDLQGAHRTMQLAASMTATVADRPCMPEHR